VAGHARNRRPDRLDRRQRDALEALALGRTSDEAGKDAGVDGATVRRWAREHPAFRAALDEIDKEAVRAASRLATALGRRALTELWRVWDDKRATVPDRIRASHAVLTHLVRLRGALQLDELAERLDALEALRPAPPSDPAFGPPPPLAPPPEEDAE
jgi:hypothetical protein